MRGLQKMVEEDRFCPDNMVQFSAVHEALRPVGRSPMRSQLKHCITHEGPDQADSIYDKLTGLIP